MSSVHWTSNWHVMHHGTMWTSCYILWLPNGHFGDIWLKSPPPRKMVRLDILGMWNGYLRIQCKANGCMCAVYITFMDDFALRPLWFSAAIYNSLYIWVTRSYWYPLIPWRRQLVQPTRSQRLVELLISKTWPVARQLWPFSLGVTELTTLNSCPSPLWGQRPDTNSKLTLHSWRTPLFTILIHTTTFSRTSSPTSQK